MKDYLEDNHFLGVLYDHLDQDLICHVCEDEPADESIDAGNHDIESICPKCMERIEDEEME